MINFKNDYNSPGHPAVIQAVMDAAQTKYPGYATDEICGLARQKILSLLEPGAGVGACVNSEAGVGACTSSCAGSGADADVHFLAGGTQANLTAISAFLRPHEAVIAAGSAHIQVHETGAIEAVGHRILLTAAGDKVTAGEVRRLFRMHTDEHMVKPRLVFISQSTELGGVYSLAELRALREACDENGLLLYMDGARLAIALTAPGSDAGLPDLAELCDAFYIGGTKNGLMFGEALVIVNEALKADFRYYQKQRGGLLAKGFLLGLQFNAIFENGLYFEIAAHANKMAARLRTGLEELGCRFVVRSLTNQIFPVFRTSAVEKLAENFLFEIWEQMGGGYTAVRFVTSWNTTEEEIEALLAACAKSIEG